MKKTVRNTANNTVNDTVDDKTTGSKSVANNSKVNKPVNKIISADTKISDFGRVNLLRITQNQDGQRIDNFLMARLKGLPKSHIYQMIRKNEIRVNKSRVQAQQKLEIGDVIRIAPVRLSTPEAPQVSTAVSDHLLSCILHEDDSIIVLNKPSGMAVHGGSGQSYGVIEALRLATSKKYLELIHRIDKETSGILLIAKKRSALKKIQQEFRDKTVKKQYQALIAGIPTFTEEKVDKPLQRYLLENGERRVRVHKEGKESSTHIQVLETYANSARVIASPLTGRTHQIRVHSLSLGHPLLGDEKYNKNDSSDAPRLCLHAWKITVPGFGSYEAPIPQDIEDYMKKL